MGRAAALDSLAALELALPRALQIANRWILPAARTLKPIARAINILDGQVTNQAVAATIGMAWDKRFEAQA